MDKWLAAVLLASAALVARAEQVVLVPGLGDDPSKFDWFVEQLPGWQATVVHIDPSDASLSFAQMSAQLAEQLPEGAFHLVGFSMGGLVTRNWIQQHPEQWSRVLSYTSLAAPNHGTQWAEVCDGRVGCRQMERGSEWLTRLNRDLSFTEAIPTLTIHTPLDAIIIPPDSTELPGADNESMLVALHPLMVRDRDVLERVVEHWQAH